MHRQAPDRGRARVSRGRCILGGQLTRARHVAVLFCLYWRIHIPSLSPRSATSDALFVRPFSTLAFALRTNTLSHSRGSCRSYLRPLCSLSWLPTHVSLVAPSVQPSRRSHLAMLAQCGVCFSASSTPYERRKLWNQYGGLRATTKKGRPTPGDCRLTMTTRTSVWGRSLDSRYGSASLAVELGFIPAKEHPSTCTKRTVGSR